MTLRGDLSVPAVPHDADKRGYLLEEYRLFHLKETRARRFSYHYHEFDKVVVFLSGQVTYTVEGRAYFLSPGDLLLVPHHHIHQPDIGGATYERYILWLTPDFLEEMGMADCFHRARSEGHLLIRPGEGQRRRLLELLTRLEEAIADRDFGHQLLSRTYCLQFLIALNRAGREDRTEEPWETYASDPKIEEIMAHINTHLADPLTVTDLAQRFYLSASWLMHRFKEVTGCSVHQYVLQKRLIHAATLIREGVPVMKAARRSGFSDYSTFLRAFRSAYGTAPRNLKSS